MAGDWKHEWYDHPEDAVELAIHIQKNRPFDEDKIVRVMLKHAEEIAEKKIKKIIEDALKEESEDELLN